MAAVVLVVVGVVAEVVVELVVVGALVVGAAVACGRVGAGGGVGLGAPLDPTVVPAIWGVSLVSPSARLAASAVRPPLGSVVVGPAMVVLEACMSRPAITGVIVVEGEARSAPVNSSQSAPQAASRLASAKATMKARAAINEIADSRTRRRSRQLRASRGTT